MRVLMFGALRESAASADDFDLPDGSTVAVVLEAVRARYPAAALVLDRCRAAVNQEMVEPSHLVAPDDEVALLPPMSGGSVWVRLSPSPSLADAHAAVAGPGAGGTVVFVGTVRDSCDAGPVDRLEYSAYEPMAVKVMREIGEAAVDRWSLAGVSIDHAVGTRGVGEITFVVVCAAARRDEAFAACRSVVDEVKERAPIWKKEAGPWGERWIGL